MKTKQLLFTQERNELHKKIRKGVIIGYIFIAVICMFIFYVPNGFVLSKSIPEILSAVICQFLNIMIIHFLLSHNVETFYIFDDRIESKTKSSIKNIVLFKNLKQIKEVTLSKGQVIYIFDDGRKDGLFNKCKYTQLNNPKYNLRIHKTEELERFISTTLASKLVRCHDMEV